MVLNINFLVFSQNYYFNVVPQRQYNDFIPSDDTHLKLSIRRTSVIHSILMYYTNFWRFHINVCFFTALSNFKMKKNFEKMNKLKAQCVIIILLYFVRCLVASAQELHEKVHPCQRECLVGEPPKICKYHFKMEWYYTMSKACYDCPYNLTDCFRPDCVPADGVERPIIVINRSLPGPSIQVMYCNWI